MGAAIQDGAREAFSRPTDSSKLPMGPLGSEKQRGYGNCHFVSSFHTATGRRLSICRLRPLDALAGRFLRPVTDRSWRMIPDRHARSGKLPKIHKPGCEEIACERHLIKGRGQVACHVNGTTERKETNYAKTRMGGCVTVRLVRALKQHKSPSAAGPQSSAAPKWTGKALSATGHVGHAGGHGCCNAPAF
jgi:hypothetical protein